GPAHRAYATRTPSYPPVVVLVLILRDVLLTPSPSDSLVARAIGSDHSQLLPASEIFDPNASEAKTAIGDEAPLVRGAPVRPWTKATGDACYARSAKALLCRSSARTCWWTEMAARSRCWLPRSFSPSTICSRRQAGRSPSSRSG